MHKLFSYGTLQMEDVQLETYGRLLEGNPDTLSGYILGELRIKDPSVIDISGEAIHPVAIKTGNKNQVIHGVIYELTDSELEQTDLYEDVDYKRVEESFHSGTRAWIYIENKNR